MIGFARWLRDLVRRFHPLFFWLWIAGLVALAPLSWLPQTTPPTGIGNVELSLDKLFHFIAYGGLAGLAMLVFEDARRRSIAVAIVLLASIVYEVGQLWAPGRSFGWDDLAANISGFVLGVALAWLIRRSAVT
ncbi:MAG: VanZ family protein [Rhodospirillales bacterium]